MAFASHGALREGYREGYEVQAVADAIGGTSPKARRRP